MSKRILSILLWWITILVTFFCGESNFYQKSVSNKQMMQFAQEQASTLNICQNPLKIFSWNVFMDNELDLIKSVILSKQPPPDILALQEVNLDMVKQLAEEFNMDYHIIFNNAILSRLPILSKGSTVINNITSRSAAWVDIELEGLDSPLRVYSVHLSFKVKNLRPFVPDVRSAEATILAEEATSLGESPAIIAGDMNTFSAFEPFHKETAIQTILDKGFYNAHALCPGNTHWAGGKIDYILYRHLSFSDCEMGDFSGSDHRWMNTSLCW